MKFLFLVLIINIMICGCQLPKSCNQNAESSFAGEGIFLFKDVEGMYNHQLVFLPTCNYRNIDSLNTLSKSDFGKGILFALYDFDSHLLELQKNSKKLFINSGISSPNDTAQISVAFGYLKYHNAYNYGKKFDKMETYVDSMKFSNQNVYEVKYFSSSSEYIDTIIAYPLKK